MLKLASCCLAVLAAGAVAQNKKVIPSQATSQDGNSLTPYFSGYGSGRAQQILDGPAVCRSTAVLRELALRADGARLAAIPARNFTQVKVTVGYTSKTPANMSTTWSANRTGQQTQIFSGAYNLPAQNASSRPFNIVWKLTAPFIYSRAKGNLLIEFEVPGRPSKSSYFFDAHRQSGATGTCRSFGAAGQFTPPQKYVVVCTNSTTLVPGGQLQVMTASFTKQFPVLFALGFSNSQYGPLKLPFDVTPLGARGNWLHVSIDALEVPRWQQGRGGWEARFAGPIPNDKRWAGLTIYAQALFADRASNQLGIVFSSGLAMTIGGGSAPAQLLGHWDTTAATGFLQRGIGIVMQLTGVFN